jgi:hypothetical protein
MLVYDNFKLSLKPKDINQEKNLKTKKENLKARRKA